MHRGMRKPDSLEIGDLVRLSGGYHFEPEWLAGMESVRGSVVAFLPGQNENPAAVIKLDELLSYKNLTDSIAVLELRYADATWGENQVVQVELCDFMPEQTPWPNRRKGRWTESHATCTRIPA